MRRVVVIILALLVTTGLIAGGCAPSAVTPEELLPAEVSLDGVHVLFAGKESTVCDVALTIRNPNTFMVGLDSMSLDLYGDDVRLGAVGLPCKAYIPAGGEATQTFTAVVAIVHQLMGPMALAMIPGKEAIGTGQKVIAGVKGGKDPATAVAEVKKGIVAEKTEINVAKGMSEAEAAKKAEDDAADLMNRAEKWWQMMLKLAMEGKSSEEIGAAVGAAFKAELMAGAMAEVAPFWKRVGEGTCQYQVKGTARIESPLGGVDTPFDFTWQA